MSTENTQVENEQVKDAEQVKAANKSVSDSQLDNATSAVGKALAKQKKKTVRLYLAPEDRQKLEAAEKAKKEVVWPYETVSINGYIYQIQRGKEVEVPQSVYDILVESKLI